MSSFSMGDGCLSPEDICAWAAREGYPSVALTDTENFYGLVRFIDAAREAGIKPLVGVRFRSASSLLLAYAMNREGYSRLSALLTSRLYAGPDAPADPEGIIGYFLERGRDGISIASDDPALLEPLLSRGKTGVFAAFVYGKPFDRIARWAARSGVPSLPVNAGRYLVEKQRDCCILLRAMAGKRTLASLADDELPGPGERLVSGDEMRRFYSACPEAFENAFRLSMEADCDGILSPRFIFPRFGDLTEGEAFLRLSALCREGVFRRYGAARPDITERIRYELGIIREKGFSSYFLVVHDIVSRCPRTCGRGSSAASIVSYLLGITHVDPLRYNLFFERFLNRGRKDPPDIDVDFPWDEREKALSYVFETYAGRSGMVADHVTYADRACLRESAKAFGLGDREIDRATKLWSRGETAALPAGLAEAAGMIRGLPWYIGSHPGGVIVTPGPVTDYVHVQPSPAGYPVIAWEKDATETAGLVKIDLLGNRSLAVLRDAIELVNDKRERPLLWESHEALDDPATRQFIETGDTLGIFYIESPATRLLLQKMGSGDYEHLVVATSIIRPAANGCIHEYLLRLKGKRWSGHPTVRETLSETLGIMVYQEDVSRIALASAGFSPEEADYLRKVLSKKAGSGILETYRDKFFRGALENGLESREVEELWQMVLSFKGYSFCKAHSASYALVSYKLAYLKRVYPLEFMISVINNGGGFYGTQVYLNAVRRLGYAVLGPDVNASGIRYSAEGHAVRMGLMQIKDVSNDFLKKLVGEREENGPYGSFRDFLVRTAPELSDLRMIVRSGALDSISGGLNRPQLFWFFYHFSLRGARGASELFDDPEVPAFIGDYSPSVKLRDEYSSTGLVFSRFPVEIFRPRIAAIIRSGEWPRLIESGSLAVHVNERISIAGTLVAGKEVETKTSKSMCFLSFEDVHAVFETVLFPDAWKALAPVAGSGSAFLLRGLVTEEYGAVVLQVEHMTPLCRCREDAGSERKNHDLPGN